ncbi:MAG: hypothetical protein IKP88_14040 [Lachnospiraceae bacterium]|nr:hypothetical protein [Lachnospiraceae bacterium]
MKISLDDRNSDDIKQKENAAKTVLDESADIYRNREQKTASETFKDLKGKAKVRYFVDYYLGKIILVTAILAIIGSVLYTTLKPKPSPVFYTIIVVSPFTPAGLDQFKADLEDMFVTDPKKEEVIMDNSYSSIVADYNSSIAYTMHMAAQEVDMLILTKDELKYQVNSKALVPIESVISKQVYEKIPDSAKHKVIPTYPLDNGDFEEGEEAVYGLNIESFLTKINGFETTDKYVIAFTGISQHADKFDDVVKYIFDIK